MERNAQVPSLQWGTAGRALTGGAESGDQCTCVLFPGGALAAVADGLGHGANAALAAKLAISVLESHAGEPPTALVQRCHEALRQTRGVVLSLASFAASGEASNGQSWAMTWLGVGNVKGVLLRDGTEGRASREWLVPRGGIVGYQLPALRPMMLLLAPGDTLILATDGIRSDMVETCKLQAFRAEENPAQAIANDILMRSRRGSDDALVLVVQVKS